MGPSAPSASPLGPPPEPLQLVRVGGVSGREGGHRGPWERPLGQAGPQWVLLEHGGLVDILHLHVDAGLAPPGPGGSRLQGGLVLHFHGEVILPTTLVVQGLGRGEQSWKSFATLGPPEAAPEAPQGSCCPSDSPHSPFPFSF